MSVDDDSDLSTPDHGSGEHVSRDHYRPVDGMMISIVLSSRDARGRRYPFRDGRLPRIRFVGGASATASHAPGVGDDD